MAPGLDSGGQRLRAEDGVQQLAVCISSYVGRRPTAVSWSPGKGNLAHSGALPAGSWGPGPGLPITAGRHAGQVCAGSLLCSEGDNVPSFSFCRLMTGSHGQQEDAGESQHMEQPYVAHVQELLGEAAEAAAQWRVCHVQAHAGV